MKHRIFKTCLIVLTFGVSAGLSWSAEQQPQQPQKSQKASSASQGKTTAKKSEATPSRAEPVDINSASKEELKKLPGIGEADADKIIAGRPYLSKAHLQTRNIISSGVYQNLQHLVVARQKDAKFGKAKK
jgi:competence protein ComEA